MINNAKSIVMDIDGTLCEEKQPHQTYAELKPREEILEALRRYKAEGFYIILATSRNMRSHNGNVGLINANTLPVLLEWLKANDVPYDEIHVGKPWCGHGGFYVDDKAIRPSEFAALTYDEILSLVGQRSVN